MSNVQEEQHEQSVQKFQEVGQKLNGLIDIQTKLLKSINDEFTLFPRFGDFINSYADFCIKNMSQLRKIDEITHCIEKAQSELDNASDPASVTELEISDAPSGCIYGYYCEVRRLHALKIRY